MAIQRGFSAIRFGGNVAGAGRIVVGLSTTLAVTEFDQSLTRRLQQTSRTVIIDVRTSTSSLPYRASVPSRIRSLILRGCPDLSRFPTDLRVQQQWLSFVELSDLPSLEFIASGTLEHCVELETLTVCRLNQLTRIDYDFAGHSGVRVLKLRNLPVLQVIERDFCSHTPRLEDVQFDDLPSLSSIGYNAFAHSGAKRIALARLPALRSIGAQFAQSSEVEIVVLEDLPSLLWIDRRFCSNARQLKRLDLSGTPALDQIDSHFLERSGFAAALSLRDQFSSLSNIGAFIGWGANVRSVELVGLPNVLAIPESFLHGTRLLQTATISDLPRLESIDNCAFFESTVAQITLSNLPNLRSIGEKFAARSRLQSLTLIATPALRAIESDFCRVQTTVPSIHHDRQPHAVSVASFLAAFAARAIQ